MKLPLLLLLLPLALSCGTAEEPKSVVSGAKDLNLSALFAPLFSHINPTDWQKVMPTRAEADGLAESSYFWWATDWQSTEGYNWRTDTRGFIENDGEQIVSHKQAQLLITKTDDLRYFRNSTNRLQRVYVPADSRYRDYTVPQNTVIAYASLGRCFPGMRVTIKDMAIPNRDNPPSWRQKLVVWYSVTRGTTNQLFANSLIELKRDELHDPEHTDVEWRPWGIDQPQGSTAHQNALLYQRYFDGTYACASENQPEDFTPFDPPVHPTPTTPGVTLGQFIFSKYHYDYNYFTSTGTKREYLGGGVVNSIDFNQSLEDNFFMQYQGYVTVEREGDYQITTHSDDGVRVKIDNQPIYTIDNWSWHGDEVDKTTVHLTAGQHFVYIEYFELMGQERLSFSIAPVSTPPVTIPPPVDNPRLAEGRFNYSIYDYYDRRKGDLVSQGTATAMRLDDFNEDYFYMEINGFINIPAPGTYAFHVTADDGVRFGIDNGQWIIDVWNDHSSAEYTVAYSFATAGWHAVSLQYYEWQGDEVLDVWWQRE